MKPKISACVCFTVGLFFGHLLQVSGDGVLGRDLSDSKQCFDVNGQSVQSGVSYTPGPDYCTVCKCEDGSPKFCRAVLCQPRPDCHSFRVGTTCCDFICLDDMLPNRPGGHPIGRLPDGTHYPAGGNGIIPHIHENGENSLGMRLAAAILTALMAFVLLLFLVHRLRQRRITAQQYVNAQDVACCHPAAYWHASDQASLFLQAPHWKPPSCVIDAPPPYTEADAQRAAARAVFSEGVATSMPSSAPPSYSGPVPAMPFIATDGGAAALPVASLSHRLEGGTDASSRDVLSSHAETRATDTASAGGAHLPPASLGPLAVQLLPSAANSADLREQIRRQRRNLTDHSTRSLPRAGHPVIGGAAQASPRHAKSPLHCTLARPPASDAGDPQLLVPFEARPPTTDASGTSSAKLTSSEIGDSQLQHSGELVQVEPSEMSLQSNVLAKESSDESHISAAGQDDDSAGTMQEPSAASNSSVRKSVLKYEAAVSALEAADTYSIGCNSPAAVASQYSPSRPTTSASRSSSSPHRKPEHPQGVTGYSTSEGLHSPVQLTAFHFPQHHNTSHHDGSFIHDSADLPSEGHVEDLQQRYPPYEAACTRQPLLPRDASSPSAKASRRRLHSLTPEGTLPGGNGSHFSSHPSKSKHKSVDLYQRSVADEEDSDANDRELFGDVGHRNAELANDLHNFRFSGRRTGRRPEPSIVNCSSGARNKT